MSDGNTRKTGHITDSERSPEADGLQLLMVQRGSPANGGVPQRRLHLEGKPKG